MSMKEFTDDVAQSSFLSHEEVANMYIGYNSNFQSCNIRFPTEPRAEPAQDTAFRCPRFESTALRPKCEAVAPQQSIVKFKVKHPISLKGVALFSAVTQSSAQLCKVELREFHLLLRISSLILFTPVTWDIVSFWMLCGHQILRIRLGHVN